MRSFVAFILFAFILFFQLKANAQPAPAALESAGQKMVERSILPNIRTESDTPMTIAQRMAFYKVKGMSVAVIKNYKVIWAKGYGMADDSLKLPVSAHTLFQAGSISKSLNSVGILKLVQEKKIDLYTDINTYLSTWKFPYDSLSGGKKITMANLLSHTAGLTIHGFGGYAVGKPFPTLSQVLNGQAPANSGPVRSKYVPGIKYEYSGGGITISQLIVMDVSHQPYAQYMFANVLKPLGMTESTYEQPPVNVKPQLLAVAYNGDKVIPGKHHVYPEQAAAGLWTNPTDLSKYIIETQKAYAGKSAKVLDQQTTQLMLKPYIDKTAALGCFIFDFDSTKYFSHEGEDAGFSAIYYGSFEGGNGVVVMVNSYNNVLMKEVVNALARVYGFKGLDQSKLKKEITLPDSVLQSYTGKYQIAPGAFLTVTREGNRLYGLIAGQERQELFPEAQNKFFLKDVDAETAFIKDDKGAVTEAVIYENGEHHAKKIK